MASMNYVKNKLEEAGLKVAVEGSFILCEDPGLFERSHDGVRGISRWLVETLSEYEEACAELFAQDEPMTEEERQAKKELMEIALEEEALANSGPVDEEEPWTYEEAVGREIGEIEPKEKPMNAVEAQIQEMQEFAPAPPVKDHIGPKAQLEVARKYHSSKEIARAAEVDDQDRGGIPSPEAYIRDMKLEAPAITILVKGQRFLAPEGWKIKEVRPGRATPIYYSSIMKGRKLNNALGGSKFSLVRL